MKVSESVVVVTHEHLPGAPHILREYLTSRKIRQLVFISHPLLAHRSRSYLQEFHRGKFIRQTSISRPYNLPMISYVVDTLLSFWWIVHYTGRVDWYIGVDPLNCAVGVILKKLGKVRRVIFYSIDFVPRRFGNPVLNRIYHFFEKVCLAWSNECWDVSPRISQGRKRFLGIHRYNKKVVPIGVEAKDIAGLTLPQSARYRIVFVGHLLEKQGVQRVIEAMPYIVKKIPQAEFLIIGGGPYEQALRRMAQALQLGTHVRFTGWVHDQKKVATLLRSCTIGVAPYVPEGAYEANFTYWADPTKIKTYLSAGLPVILTDVPYNARELQKKGCAVVVPYTANALGEAIVTLLSDTKRINDMRKNAIAYAKIVTWDRIFQKATGLA